MGQILLHKAEKYSVDMGALSDQTKTFLLKNFGCARKVYNLYVSILYETLGAIDYQRGQKLPEIKYPEISDFKKKFPYLKEADSLGLSNAKIGFENAIKRYNELFDHVSHTKGVIRKANAGTEPLSFVGLKGMPRYHSKVRGDFSYKTNCQYPDANNNLKRPTIRLDEGMLHVPKVPEDIRLVMHRPLPDGVRIGNVTLSMDCKGKMYAAIEYSYYCQVDGSLREAVASGCPFDISGLKILGLDYSQEHFYVDNNGETGDYPHFYRKSEAKLAKLQKELSRMKKGSSNYGKKLAQIKKLHAKIRNQRRDFLNKLSTKLVQKYDVIAVEDIDLRAMGQTLKLGKNLHDNGFGMFREMLSYKLEAKGSVLVKVDRMFPSTKRCNACGTVNNAVVLGVKKWTCPSCGVSHDRDQNAAKNIRDEAIRILPEYMSKWLEDDNKSRARAEARTDARKNKKPRKDVA